MGGWGGGEGRPATDAPPATYRREVIQSEQAQGDEAKYPRHLLVGDARNPKRKLEHGHVEVTVAFSARESERSEWAAIDKLSEKGDVRR